MATTELHIAVPEYDSEDHPADAQTGFLYRTHRLTGGHWLRGRLCWPSAALDWLYRYEPPSLQIREILRREGQHADRMHWTTFGLWILREEGSLFLDVIRPILALAFWED